MISVLLPLCLLPHLIAPGYTLKCIECFNNTAPQCTGPTKDCDVGICMSGLISFGDYTLFGRSCAPSESTCGVSGSITSTGRAMLSTSCCKTNGCTPDELKLPPLTTLKNGVTCQTCASSQEQCPIECTGDEKNCASVELTTLRPGLSTKLRGCATDSVCTFGNHTFDVAGLVMNLGIVCRSSASAVVLQYCSLFLTLGFAIFMTKPLL